MGRGLCRCRIRARLYPKRLPVVTTRGDTMRNLAIGLLGLAFLLPGAAQACPGAKLTMAQAATTELAADTTEKKKVRKTKMKKEKVEYMRSAAPPPEPKR